MQRRRMASQCTAAAVREERLFDLRTLFRLAMKGEESSWPAGLQQRWRWPAGGGTPLEERVEVNSGVREVISGWDFVRGQEIRGRLRLSVWLTGDMDSGQGDSPWKMREMKEWEINYSLLWLGFLIVRALPENWFDVVGEEEQGFGFESEGGLAAWAWWPDRILPGIVVVALTWWRRRRGRLGRAELRGRKRTRCKLESWRCRGPPAGAAALRKNTRRRERDGGKWRVWER